MSLDVFWHEDVLLHDTGHGVFESPASPLMAVDEPHPEGPTRIRNMKSILERGPLAEHVRWHAGRHATREELELLHERDYIDEVEALAAAGGGQVTRTTLASGGTLKATTAAAGTAIAATEAVLDGDARIAYALVRPPGHHAQPAMADGYCFFNSSGLAAEVARRRGVARVAVVDLDVHHGNGTQECFYARDDVLTVSLHMAHRAWGPTHPQTGAPDELGTGAGLGYNVNVNMPYGTGDAGYAAAVAGVVDPLLERFAPELVVIACGQDASQFDPTARQTVTMAGFHALGRAVRRWADTSADGRLVLVQEGGYAPSYAAWCLHATLEGALGLDPALEDPLAYMPDDARVADEAIAATRAALAPHWDL